ncbi:MAG: UDP-N-acetylmuramoyl-L-alanyl-D-glutamate--2,6-diaminopimelate ligase [Treponemataceae bacterium]|nr:MAG: UDP-N-acetylmuramoyl-L-alanyl-D-glutamate--2,6-diaminopimelate ligase [Treponemataceae bacterium]
MRKNLSAITGMVTHTATHAPEADPAITGLAFDSRDVTAGSLFFALPGTHTTGNKFIADAVRAGAAAVVYEGELDPDAERALAESGAAGIKVDSARFSMSPIAAAFFDFPSRRLITIGVTGTEGKSSTVSFIWQLLRLCGKKAGFISTVQYSTGGGAVDNPQHQTTPEAPIVQSQLADMARNGCEYAVVESSSHGLSPRTNRLGDVLFDAGIMMNVAHEHLEFHGTWEQYRDDKANLFRALLKHNHEKIICGNKIAVRPFAVINADDPSAGYFAGALAGNPGCGVYGFSAQLSVTGGKAPDGLAALCVARDISATEEGISFNAKDSSAGEFFVNAPLPGSFNAANLLASIIAVSNLTGIPAEDVARKTGELLPVRGRMTRVVCGQDFEVIVDYAHTPSSFNVIFPAIRARAKGKIVCLFGSGGERDTAKRPEQGKIAARFCDIVILSDEDPRGEDPAELLKMIEAGCVAEGKIPGKDVLVIPDRPLAIRKAFSLAQKNDIVLLLGKSHENSIIYKDFVMPYDEFAEAKKALAELGYGDMP